jgi:hypothetical protein
MILLGGAPFVVVPLGVHQDSKPPMIQWKRKRGSVALLVCGCLIAASSACAQPCEIDPSSIGGVRIGASKADVVAQLSGRYSVAEEAKPGSSPTLVARARTEVANVKPAMIIGLDSDRVFLIDSHEGCVTKEGIGPGMTLGRAQEAYGRGQLDPTDLGYFIWFDRKAGVMFLIDERDIPASLRGIADDAISPEQEREILSLQNARIVMARVAAQ